MALRTPSLQNDSLVGINREIGSQYDNVKTVAEHIDSVVSVAEDKTNVDIVAANVGNVAATVSNIVQVVTTAAHIDEVVAVAANIADVRQVADALDDIGAALEQVVPHLDEILLADDNAATATTKAAEATSQATAATAARVEAETARTTATTKAAEAAVSANSASTSATTATTKASEASASATSASVSAGTASTKADEASTSATSAAGSATTATTKANIATTKASEASASATTASTKASGASASATSAATSAATATTKAGEASASATAAAASQTSAATKAAEAAASATAAHNSEVAAAAILDAFDDRYLGSFTADPTVDNDGQALLDGALYFNTASNALKVYDAGTVTWLVLPQIYLSTLLDVQLTSLATGDVLKWNGSRWVNTAQASLTAGNATKLATSRTISLSTDATGSASFDGSTNATIAVTLANVPDSGTGTFKKIATDTKGRVTGTQAVVQADITGLLGAGSISNTMLANSAVANLSGTNTGDQTTITGNAGTATKLQTARTINGVSFDGSANITINAVDSTARQPLSSDLTAIDALAGTSGFLKKTATDTWTLDTNTYVTSSGVTSVAGTSPVVSSGGTTPAIRLAAGYGDTLNPYASKTANYVLAAPSGSAGVPTFRAITATDIPTLNQNTTGSAATLTTGRTLGITGDMTWTSPSFNGSSNVTAAGTLATVNSNVGSFTNASITVNAKGLVTAASSGTAPVTTVTGTAPIVSSGGTAPAISISAATTSAAGSMSAADKTKLDGIATGATANVGTVTSIATSGAITGGTITSTGTISHSTADGYLHVPATSTTNNGKVLTAGATAGSLSWTTPSTGTVTRVVGGSYLTGGTITTSGTLAVDATSANTASKVVARDASGNFAAGTITAALTGNASTATKLATARTISLTGDVTGNVSFDGSAGVTGVATLANSGVISGTYKSVTVDAKGRVTAGTNPTTLSGYGITDAQPLDATLTALAGVTTSADKYIYATASDTFTTGTITSFGRSLVDDDNATTARTTLGISATNTPSTAVGGISATNVQGAINEIAGNLNNLSQGFNDLNSAVVHKTGDETIADVKTFTRSPIVPTPTTDMQVATKQYVDSKILQATSTEVYAGPYGLNWDETNDVYLRTGSTNYKAIQSLMRRCVMNDNGTVNYYLHPHNSNYKADGTAADLTGASGNVMVEVPKFYYKYNYNTAVGVVHEHSISLTPLDGYTVHDAFVRGGVEKDYRYYPAYLGYSTGSKLQSRSGVYPTVNQTRAQFRTLARANGAGWEQIDFLLYEAITLLMVIEYGTMNIQNALGQGRTALTGETWVNGSLIGINGLSNVVGNGTANVTYAGSADDAAADGSFMTYRGCENFFGNVWRFVDGINCNGSNSKFIYVNMNPATYADSVITGDYVSIGVTSVAADGYARKLGNTRKGFIPTNVTGGTSANGTTDYYYTSPTVDTLARVGGGAYHGLNAGPLSLAVNDAPSLSYVFVGAGVSR